MIKASGIYMAGRALTALLTIASIAIFSRLLAPSDYGVYTLTITTAGIFNALFCTWVAQSVFRLYSENPDQVRLQSTGFVALTVSAIFSAAAALVAIFMYGKPITAELAAAMLLLFSGYSFVEYSNVQLTAQQRPYAFAQLQLTKLLLSLLLPLIAWLVSGRFDHFMLALGAAFWLPLLVPRFSSWASGAALRHVDRPLLRAMASYGFPLSCSLLLMLLGISLDRYLLGAYHGLGSVGGYAAGADLAFFSIGTIASSLNQAFYPRLLQLDAMKDRRGEKRFFSEYVSLFIALLLPAAVGLHFIADELAWLVVGSAMRADTAASLTLFSITALFLNFKSFVIDIRFQIARKMTFPIIHAVIIVGMLFGGGLMLIPAYGGVGAAWASLAAIMVGCLIALVSSIVVVGSLPARLNDLAKIFIATAVMASVLYGIGDGLAPLTALATKIFAGMAVYGIMLFILNFAPVREGLSSLKKLRASRHQL